MALKFLTYISKTGTRTETQTQMKLLEHLQWRYATKKYTDQKVSEDKITQIVKAISLTASSRGLQPYRLLVINNPQVKKQLAQGSFNTQIEHSSHLLVFAAFNHLDADYIGN